MRDIFVLGVILATMPLAVMDAFVGLMLWAWTSLLQPTSYLYGFMVSVPVNRLAAIVTIVALIPGGSKAAFRFDPIAWLLIGMVVLGSLSMAINPLAPDIGWEIHERLIKAAALYIVAIALLNTRLKVHALLLVIALSMGFNAVVEGMKFLASGGGHRAELANIGDNNHFACAVLMTLPIVAYLAQTSKNKAVRLALVGALAAGVAAVIGTYSRGGFVGLAICVVLAIASGRHKVRNALFCIVACAVLIQFLPASWFDRINTIQDANSDDSFMGRVVAWKFSILIALNSPLFGGGFYAVQSDAVWATLMSQFETLSFIPSPPPDSAKAAHSIYFQVLGDLGFTGLALFLAIIVLTWRNITVIGRMTRGDAGLRWACDLAGALRVSLIAFIVAGAALSLAYFEMFYVICAIASSLRLVVQAATVGVVPAKGAGRAVRAGAQGRAQGGEAVLAPGRLRPAAPLP
jgi:probable O-glycosylation ligase (exosortase A-associated)